MHRQPAPGPTENSKIEKSAKDFESILLGSWLQQAEQSFGTVPGGDGDDDADAGKDQLQGMAMQSLGTSMTNSGGIGIAKMIAKQLHKAQDAEDTAAAKVHPAEIKF
jgi:Rod binding domain-containing protein